jgi:hypothetical protein
MEAGMNINPHDYALSFTDVPKPLLVDEDPVTENWPLPQARTWDSARKPSLWERWQNFVDDVLFGDFGDE